MLNFTLTQKFQKNQIEIDFDEETVALPWNFDEEVTEEIPKELLQKLSEKYCSCDLKSQVSIENYVCGQKFFVCQMCKKEIV